MSIDDEKKISGAAQCPDPEIISAWYDRELDENHPVAAHIKSCPKCAESLKAYGIIDQKLKKIARDNTPDNLVYSVKVNFERKLKAAANRSSIRFPASAFARRRDIRRLRRRNCDCRSYFHWEKPCFSRLKPSRSWPRLKTAFPPLLKTTV